MTPRLRLPAALAAALLLAGCASTAIDDNYRALTDYGGARLGSEPRWLRSDAEREAMTQEVDRTLAAGPLAADDAVRIALGYSPDFQIVLAEAATASADATASARMPNPVFSFEKLVRRHDGDTELDIGRSLGISLLDLLLLPARLERAELRQQQTRLQASTALVERITAVRQAWTQAVAAQQIAAAWGQLTTASAAGAELAQRMRVVGNFSQLQAAREQSLHADAVASGIRARQTATGAREALVRLLGLSPQQAATLRLPSRLPELPATPLDEAGVGRSLIEDRLDIRLARADLDRTAKDLGLTRVTSIVNGLHVAGVNNSETGEAPQRGFEIELPLPLFDFGDASRAGAEARYLAAFNRSLQVARNASSQLRTSYEGYRNAHDLARHYRDEIVPLRSRIADESVLQYNGMLIGVFELLADSRNRAAGVIAALEAERDFWLADAALRAAMLGTPIAPLALQASAAPAAADGGH
ncbi:TolC family protein [Azoarcus olearius]|uniref:Putativemetal ion efflux outer membrane protein n=1 Tax=Azoarcus sp. (strain BH72) TaxID=418699 RepID=A1K9R0_AZOSB|nr:TolC family protein [Azoarcus olearius]CAL95565.1 putativemetal ion efflux outer membrane protein [Azoarcus olearius]